MATHSSILALRIPWTEEPGGLYPQNHKELGMTEVTQHSTKGKSVFNFLSNSDIIYTISKTASVQFSSVSQSCPTLCDPLDRNTPGLPVHDQYPKLAQTHVHSMMPSNHLILCRPLLLSCVQSLPASGSFQMHQFFTSGGQSIGASAKVFPVNIQD